MQRVSVAAVRPLLRWYGDLSLSTVSPSMSLLTENQLNCRENFYITWVTFFLLRPGAFLRKGQRGKSANPNSNPRLNAAAETENEES